MKNSCLLGVVVNYRIIESLGKRCPVCVYVCIYACMLNFKHFYMPQKPAIERKICTLSIRLKY